MNLLLELAGWLGTAALLLAYALVSTRRLAGDSPRYQALNLVGGALVLVNSFYHGAMPSVAVNAFWIAIAVFALSRVRLRPDALPATAAERPADDAD
jgi:hypothetical protein